MNSEEIKNEFVNCVEGTHTLNLAISILEERDLYYSIIKEVREYVKKYRTMVDGYEDEKTGQMIYEHRLKLNKHQVRKLLEILDKENI